MLNCANYVQKLVNCGAHQMSDHSASNPTEFRIAVFGDFTGRAARGVMETGQSLRARRPIGLDIDTVEDVIESFATKLSLSIGKDGVAIDVRLNGLDDLHPEQLYDNVELFSALSSVRQSLSVGSMADEARAKLKVWSETFGTTVRLPTRSSSNSVPANMKLTDFQALIGYTSELTKSETPIDDIIARIVGPHIVKAPDAQAPEMEAAVDDALSSAMRLILHHPDFQSLEAQWRSIDFLARRIETDGNLEVVLYDVSAEELAFDIAAADDLSESGIFGLLSDAQKNLAGKSGYSALIGLYTFEETPPHADLLSRIAQIAAHVDAPFFAAMSPDYLDIPKEKRHPLVTKAWDALRVMPEANYIGLLAPQFMLRLPYGAKSDPIASFKFEEFTEQVGLSGILWANPAVLVAILLAETYHKNTKVMDLGSVMSIGDIPYHYLTDRNGDQVAMPCTKRNLTSASLHETLSRGFMPVEWVKGRNEIRLATFVALGGNLIEGPWTAQVHSNRVRPVPNLSFTFPVNADDNVGGLDNDAALTELLAVFEDEGKVVDPRLVDAELATLLKGL